MTLSESQIERVIGAFSAGAGWTLAARILSIPPSTLRRAIEADPAVAERVADARAMAVDQVEKSLFNRAVGSKDGKPSDLAIIFYLKNKRPDEWRDRHDTGPSKADLDAAARRAAEEMGVDPDAVLELAKKIVEDAEAFPVSPRRKVQ